MLKFSRAASLAAAAFASAAGAQSVSFATLPPGSILHAQASVIAKVVQDHSKLQVRVNGYDGDAPILEAVTAQKADFLLLDVGEVAAAGGGLRLLPADKLPDAERRMKKVRTEYYFSRVSPAPNIAGVDKPSRVQTIDVVVAVGTHVKNDVVYEFVKAMRENRRALVEGHPIFSGFDERAAGKRQARLPHHPGAIKYFRETSS